jgi:small subunit ribosomal protein S1
VDKKNEKVSLGLKQKTESPWQDVEDRYQINSRVKGTVVNVMNYGVFVRLEDGIEGLVHISEMSWTKRLNHPSEMLNVGDKIEVIVLNVNKEKQEISLGLKQTETNPWAIAAQKYPQGTIVTAKVHSLTNFGVFVEIEEGIDGMIHISDLSWTRKYSHPSEALKKGHEIKCVVLEMDEEKQRVSLGIKQLNEDPWIRAIPEKYIPGHIIKGEITKITNFGAFVQLEPELEGLLHISELADHKIDKPQDIIKVDQEVEVKILKVDTEARKIGLSLRRAQWAAEDKDTEKEPKQSPPPSVTQTVLSDEHVQKITEPQEKEEKAADTEPDAGEQTEASEKTEVSEQKDTSVQAEVSEQTEEKGKADEPKSSEQELEKEQPSQPDAQNKDTSDSSEEKTESEN